MAGTARETSLIFLTRILLTLEDDSTSTPTSSQEDKPRKLKKAIWSGRPVSNRLPQPWEGCALPGELRPLGRPSILSFLDDAFRFGVGLRDDRPHQRRILLHQRPRANPFERVRD